MLARCIKPRETMHTLTRQQNVQVKSENMLMDVEDEEWQIVEAIPQSEKTSSIELANAVETSQPDSGVASKRSSEYTSMLSILCSLLSHSNSYYTISYIFVLRQVRLTKGPRRDYFHMYIM